MAPIKSEVMRDVLNQDVDVEGVTADVYGTY